MNITAINPNKIEYTKKDNHTTFNGPILSSMFMAVNKHEIIGVSAIDLLSMVIPRTLVDFTRNKEAGIETMFREGSSTATNASIGLAGVGAASLLALGLKNRNYGVDFKSINANSDTIEAMANLFKSVLQENPTLAKEELSKVFLNRVFDDVQGLSGNADLNDTKLWHKLGNTYRTIGDSSEAINPKESIVRILLEQQKEKSFKLNSDALEQIRTYLNVDIPSLQDLKVNIGGKEVMTKGEHFIADVHALTKAFTQDNVISTFKEATVGASAKFVEDLKTLSIRKTALGLAAICTVGLSWQAINRHMTQKRTGIKGFVGDPNYGKKEHQEKKKDHTFLPLKALISAIMGFYIFKTINAKNMKDFISKIQFKGSLPTMEQIKLVYGSVILGRLLASSDKNELRESAFRDFMGYTNFLVLGAMLTKWYVNKKDKSLINYDPASHGKGFWNWIKNSTIKTHEEILNATFKTDMLKDKGVKTVKELHKSNWIQKGSKLADKLSVLNKARILAIGYACVVLGIIIPLVNKYTTKLKEKNRQQEEPTMLKLDNLNIPPENPQAQKIIDNFLQKNLLA